MTIAKEESRYVSGVSAHSPAVGRCECRFELELSHNYNRCACGRVYNKAGVELEPHDLRGTVLYGAALRHPLLVLRAMRYVMREMKRHGRFGDPVSLYHPKNTAFFRLLVLSHQPFMALHPTMDQQLTEDDLRAAAPLFAEALRAYVPPDHTVPPAPVPPAHTPDKP